MSDTVVVPLTSQRKVTNELTRQYCQLEDEKKYWFENTTLKTLLPGKKRIENVSVMKISKGLESLRLPDQYKLQVSISFIRSFFNKQ